MEEIFSYLTKRKGVIEGVCISGGEPSLQKDLPDFCQKIKELGYPIKLDTNGTNPKMVKMLAKEGLVDYFAMDIKNNLEDYASIIGFDKYDTKNIESSVEFFLGGGAPYEFRTTLIKEFHKEENIVKIGQWIKGANKYFLQKFKDSDSCIQSHLSAVDDSQVAKFKEILQKTIPNTYLRGY
jgi:pyruvate formate lyase activating enzyme